MRGFTLLELLVVLLLIGLVAGLMVPRLSTLYDSAVSAYRLQDVLQQISALGYQAYQRGKTYRLTQLSSEQKSKDLPLTLPKGWSIGADAPILYYPNGVCTGGIITLQQQFVQQQWELQPPLCQPQPYDAG